MLLNIIIIVNTGNFGISYVWTSSAEPLLVSAINEHGRDVGLVGQPPKKGRTANGDHQNISITVTDPIITKLYYWFSDGRQELAIALPLLEIALDKTIILCIP